MKRLSEILKCVLPLFIVILIQTIVINTLNFLVGAFIGFKIGLEKGTEKVIDSANLTQAIDAILTPEISYLISVIAVLVCGVVFFFWYRSENRGEETGRSRNVFTVKNVFLFIVLGMGCQFFFTGVMNLLKPFLNEIFENYSDTMEAITAGSDLEVLFLVVLAAPIAEELIFRGVILHKANKVIPFIGANILQALLFGIYHWNIVQGVYATLIGLLLGVVYRKYKTIFAPILLHMMINSSAFLALLVPNRAVSYLAVGGVIFIIVTLLIIKPFSITKKVE